MAIDTPDQAVARSICLSAVEARSWRLMPVRGAVRRAPATTKGTSRRNSGVIMCFLCLHLNEPVRLARTLAAKPIPLEPDDQRDETCIRAQRRHIRSRRPAVQAAVAFELQRDLLREGEPDADAGRGEVLVEVARR